MIPKHCDRNLSHDGARNGTILEGAFCISKIHWPNQEPKRDPHLETLKNKKVTPKSVPLKSRLPTQCFRNYCFSELEQPRKWSPFWPPFRKPGLVFFADTPKQFTEKIVRSGSILGFRNGTILEGAFCISKIHWPNQVPKRDPHFETLKNKKVTSKSDPLKSKLPTPQFKNNDFTFSKMRLKKSSRGHR